MKIKVEYKYIGKRKIKVSRKPLGKLKIRDVYLVPMERNQFHLYISFNTRSVEINSWGSGGTFGNRKDPLYESITFEIPDEQDIPAIWAEVIFYPETKAECNLDLFGSMWKDYYSGVMIPGKLISRSWNAYCKRQTKRKKDYRMGKEDSRKEAARENW